MSADLYLKNGLVVTEELIFHGGVVIAEGKIVELVAGDTAVSAKVIIDVAGKAILPGSLMIMYTSMNRDASIGKGIGPAAWLPPLAVSQPLWKCRSMPRRLLSTVKN